MSKELKKILSLIVLAGSLLYASHSFAKSDSKAKLNEK